MRQSLGEAVVEVRADTAGFTKDVASGVSSSASAMDSPAKKAGGRFSSILGKTLKRTLIGVGATGGAVLTAGIAKGFSRLSAIDIAKSQLRGLKLEGQEIESVMDSATAAVTGTAYGLDEAASAAAGALGANVQQGKELTEYLTLVADATTQSTTDFNSMALMLNKVEGAGKLTNGILTQMAMNGLQVMPMLTKEYGVNAAEMQKMVTDGKVSSEEFKRILSENIGGAAMESGSTVQGAYANMMAALGRVGAKALEGPFGKLPDLMGTITGALDKLGPKVEAGAAKLGELAGIAWDNLKPAATRLKNIAEIGWGNLKDGVKWLQDLKGLDLSEALGKIDGKALGERLGTAISDGLGALVSFASDVTKKITEMMGQVDWAGIGIAVGTQVPAMLIGLFAGLLSGEAIDAIFQAIGDHWQAILIGALTLAFSPARMLGPLTKILSKIPFVGSFLSSAVTWFNNLGGRLLGFIRDLFSNAWRGFTSTVKFPGAGVVKAIVGAIRGLPQAVRNFLETLQIRIGSWALDAFSAIGRGGGRAMSTVLGFVKSIPGRIVTGLGALGGVLLTKGSELIRGLLTGIREKASEVMSFIRELPGKAREALGDVGSSLVGAGKSLMGGLISGITSRIGDVGSAIKRGAETIGRFLPGSPVKEGPLKAWNNGAAGKKLMGMLAQGIASQARKMAGTVKRSVADPLVAGVAEGLKESEQKSINKAVRSLSTSLRKALKGLDASDSMGWVREVNRALKEHARAARQVGKGSIYFKNVNQAIGQGALRMRDFGERSRALSRDLEKATAKLNRMKEVAAGLRDSLRSELSLGDLFSEVEGMEPNQFGFGGSDGSTRPPTFKDIAGRVKQVAARARTFASLIKKMRNAGIPPGLINEVSSLGSEEGIAVAKALLSGSRAQIKSLSADWAGMNAAAQSAGNQLAKTMERTGIQAQEGLIRGLNRKNDRLDKAARNLANRLTQALKKALKIKSPSVKLADEIGVPSGEGVGVGMIRGMDDMRRAVNREVATLIQPLTPQQTYASVLPADRSAPHLSPVSSRMARGVGSAAALTLSDDQINRLADAMSSRTMNLDVTVGADTRTKANWYLEGQRGAEILR